ncbi:MAG: nucleotide excision repair endonuclease [Verrucomicrobiales bacterium]|nr:nucleotide excision repair endonuclease [Verrucomicrobiales bacterium]
MKQARLFPAPQPLVERLGAGFFRTIPKEPGVYRMFDATDALIYVGKAGDLRARLSSYRRTTDQSAKTRRLIHTVRRIEWQVCASETEARLLENQLIRTLRPRFNRAGTWPASARFLKLTWQAAVTELTLGVQAVPEGESYGAFRGGVAQALAALARLTWYAGVGTTDPRQLPRPLVGRAGIRCWTWSGTLAGELLPDLRTYLTGNGDPLVARLVSAVPEPSNEFERAFVAADFEEVAEFYRRGPHRNRALQLYLDGAGSSAVAGTTLSPEQRDDLWVRWSAEHTPTVPRLEFPAETHLSDHACATPPDR